VPTNVLVLNKSWVVTGASAPEGAHAAPVGSIFLREDGDVGTSFYIKETGAGNTGWKAVGAAAPPGDVVGPAVSVADAIALFSGTTGKLLKDSQTLLTTLAQKTINNNFTVGQTITGSLNATDLGTTPLNADNLASGTVPTARLPSTVGDVKGPASSLNNSVALFSGTTGKLLIDSGTLFSNIARTNLSNSFTVGPQVFSKVQPILALVDTGQAANLKRFDLTVLSQTFKIQAMDDIGTVLFTPLSLDRSGNATVQGAFTAAWVVLSERTAPTAPAANGANLWVQDNGSGKTQLMVQFNTGSAIQLAIQV
jgi:hypothetical protein